MKHFCCIFITSPCSAYVCIMIFNVVPYLPAAIHSIGPCSQGRYDRSEDFGRMVSYLEQLEGNSKANRVYYFAIPPEVFLHTAACVNVSIIHVAPSMFMQITWSVTFTLTILCTSLSENWYCTKWLHTSNY